MNSENMTDTQKAALLSQFYAEVAKGGKIQCRRGLALKGEFEDTLNSPGRYWNPNLWRVVPAPIVRWVVIVGDDNDDTPKREYIYDSEKRAICFYNSLPWKKDAKIVRLSEH